MHRLRGKEAIGKTSAMSPLNFSDEIRKDMELPKQVKLVDMTLKEGLSRMVYALAAKLDGERIRLATRVTSIEAAGNRYKIQRGDGATLSRETIGDGRADEPAADYEAVVARHAA